MGRASHEAGAGSKSEEKVRNEIADELAVSSPENVESGLPDFENAKQVDHNRINALIQEDLDYQHYLEGLRGELEQKERDEARAGFIEHVCHQNMPIDGESFSRIWQEAVEQDCQHDFVWLLHRSITQQSPRVTFSDPKAALVFLLREDRYSVFQIFEEVEMRKAGLQPDVIVAEIKKLIDAGNLLFIADKVGAFPSIDADAVLQEVLDSDFMKEYVNPSQYLYGWFKQRVSEESMQKIRRLSAQEASVLPSAPSQEVLQESKDTIRKLLLEALNRDRQHTVITEDDWAYPHQARLLMKLLSLEWDISKEAEYELWSNLENRKRRYTEDPYGLNTMEKEAEYDSILMRNGLIEQVVKSLKIVGPKTGAMVSVDSGLDDELGSRPRSWRFRTALMAMADIYTGFPNVHRGHRVHQGRHDPGLVSDGSITEEYIRKYTDPAKRALELFAPLLLKAAQNTHDF